MVLILYLPVMSNVCKSINFFLSTSVPEPDPFSGLLDPDP